MISVAEKHHHLFKFYGSKAKEYRQKCIGLLPEIYKSGIYRQKGFESIFEYAAKLAGLSHDVVRRVLSLEERFRETPLIKGLLTEGKISIHKLARVASVVNKENEEFWANQVQILPQQALETLVKDERIATTNLHNMQENRKSENGLRKTFFDQNFVRAHKTETENKTQTVQIADHATNGRTQTANQQTIASKLETASEISSQKASINDLLKLDLDKTVVEELLALQNKGINVSQLLGELLEKRELEIAQKKEQIASGIKRQSSRYITVKIKKILSQEHGTKCSIKTCTKPSETIHHTQRFALAGTHDPHYLAPLCREHHTIAHSIDLKFQKMKVMD